jgi:dienelactone hydrolase
VSRDIDIEIPVEDGRIVGTLALPNDAESLVLLVDGNGRTRLSPRIQFVAEVFRRGHFGTFLLDLVTAGEGRGGEVSARIRFDSPLLAGRVVAATDWLASEGLLPGSRLGYFGASTGAAAVLLAAAQRPATVGAVVSLGGRPDLASASLGAVVAPTLLIVARDDDGVVTMNQDAWETLAGSHKDLRIVTGRSHPFEDPGVLDEAADLAREWFEQFLMPRIGPPAVDARP